MVILAVIALSLSQGFAAGAAGLCAVLFFVPGLFFLNHTRRLYLRDVALAHAAQLADSKGVTDVETTAKELDLPRKDAELILRKAIDEGLLRGDLDTAGRFVATSAPRCPSCKAPLARDKATGVCPRCGASLAGG